MVEVEISEYLNVQTCNDNDIVVVTGEATYGTIKDNKTNKEKKVLNIPVRIDKRSLIYTPSSIKVLKDLVSKWGKNTKDWIGKKFQVEIRVIESFGKEMEVVRPVFMD